MYLEMSVDTFRSLLTGLSQGSFDTLLVRNANGDMVDVLTLGGGGSGAVTSANAPLAIDGSFLSINLARYGTSNALATGLAGKTDTTFL